jgi:L-rhamnose mutarotase
MFRVGILYKLKPGCIEEYRYVHDRVWPEQENAVKKAGVKNYTLFFDTVEETLFGYLETDDFKKVMKVLNDEKVNTYWSNVMDRYFEKEDKLKEGLEFKELEEIHHID